MACTPGSGRAAADWGGGWPRHPIEKSDRGLNGVVPSKRRTEPYGVQRGPPLPREPRGGGSREKPTYDDRGRECAGYQNAASGESAGEPYIQRSLRA